MKSYLSGMRLLMLYLMLWFLQAIPAGAQAVQLHKLSPMLRKMAVEVRRCGGTEVRGYGGTRVRRYEGTRVRGYEGTEVRMICAFVRITDDADRILREHGCRELARSGDIYIAAIPADQLASLTQEKNVERIEAQRGMRTQMDLTPRVLNALPAYEGTALPQAYTGKDVVVGVMDIGFDLTHPNFYDATATNYRIKCFWDHISPDTIGSELFVGRDYTTEGELLTLGCSYDGKSQTHGTHTLGTAAGSGYDSPYRGMAWESDLCIVNNATSEDIDLIDPKDYEKYTFATDALGFKYIFDYAKSVGKPCVISFSEGAPQDFYGYDVLYYQMLSDLVGPGRILVASAGNLGETLSYIGKERGRERAGTFLLSYAGQLTLTAKADAPFTLRTTVYGGEEPLVMDIPTEKVVTAEDSCYTDSMLIGDRMCHFTVMAYPSCYIETETCYDVEIRMIGHLGIERPLAVEFVGKEATIDVYGGYGDMGTNALRPDLDDAEATHNVHSPSSAPRVICVGATSYRTGITNYLGEYREYDMGTNGQRGEYSSVGPTWDGRIKPDVMAPGTNIISSYSSYYLENNPQAGDIRSDVEHFDFRGRTYAWNSNAGTSMSTPVVAGAIALWLQANPSLTPEEIIGVIERTSSHYDPALSYPNNLYGYGQIDVYRGLLDILGIDGIDGLSNHQPQGVTVRPEGNDLIGLHFQKATGSPFAVRVYNTAGKLVASHVLDGLSEHYCLNLSHLPKGVYAVQVDTKEAKTTGSTLVRK